jgi:AcrR family transcriptional regulator
VRADAEANLDRVIDAAEAVFDEYGLDVSIELVAKRAGVGLGTIYRRFKNKDALIAEVVRRLLTDVVRLAESHAGVEGGLGLFAYMGEVGNLLASRRGSVARIWSDPATEDLVKRSRDAQGRLLAEAQKHRLVRQDLTKEDVAVALWSIHGVLDITRGLAVDAWHRQLDIIVAGWTNSEASLSTAPLQPYEMTAVIQHSPSSASPRKRPRPAGG